jgi:cytoskeleton protein RodZ
MPEIGATLREARMRQRIDISDVEAQTKIRAKYLRALENEEWELLPGPTFVKSFLRTYAEYLELDARTLVEDYKQRFEGPAGAEPAAFGGLGVPRRQQRPPPRGRGRRRSNTMAAFGPGLAVGIGVVALLGIFYLLGVLGQEDTEMPVSNTPTPTETAVATATATPDGTQKDRKPTRVRLELVATGDVYVCLVDGAGKRLLDGVTLQQGVRTKRFTARRLLANFGTSAVRMRVDGRAWPVAESAKPVGYELRPGRKPRRLPDAQRPDCS